MYDDAFEEEYCNGQVICIAFKCKFSEIHRICMLSPIITVITFYNNNNYLQLSPCGTNEKCPYGSLFWMESPFDHSEQWERSLFPLMTNSSIQIQMNVSTPGVNIIFRWILFVNLLLFATEAKTWLINNNIYLQPINNKIVPKRKSH